MNMLLIIILALMLSACATQPQCVRVAYYDYGTDGCIQGIHQFSGKYYPGSVGNNKGMVFIDTYLGDGNRRMFEQCDDPANLADGWYYVFFDVGQGTYILSGEGHGGMVDIVPNYIPQKTLLKQF
jgi:hypothetical protein